MNVKDVLDSIFLVSHPIDSINKIWDHAKRLRPHDPTNAFRCLSDLKLVGPFKFIEPSAKENDQDCAPLAKFRYATDLPEMQTVMTYVGGRFCYWRDTPNESEPMLIHVSAEPENFPKMDIIGDSDLYCVIHCLYKLESNNAESLKHLLPMNYDFAHYDKLAADLRANRRKKTVGRPFHGLGINVTVENDVGYRPVTDDLRRLQREIESMGTTTNEKLKDSLRRNFLELHANIQYANDEKDFGMGLEFGHDIFVANYECFDGLAKSVLIQAYQLLDRHAFVEILEAHYKAGRRNYNNIK